MKEAGLGASIFLDEYIICIININIYYINSYMYVYI